MEEHTYTKPSRVRMGPTRSTCEEIIRRILTTELSEFGENTHFKTAADFMSYFESLYPAGGALTKQVQRAIKAMDMAKDDRGYFILDKTKTDQKKEKEISDILKKTNAGLSFPGNPIELLFLKAEQDYRSYLIALLKDAPFNDMWLTFSETSDGLVFYTEDRNALCEKLDELCKH